MGDLTVYEYALRYIYVHDFDPWRKNEDESVFTADKPYSPPLYSFKHMS